LNQLFRADVEDGSMEQLLTVPHSIGVMMFAKIAAHWLLTGLPVILMAPFLGMTYHLGVDDVGVLVLSLLLGTPTLCLMGAIGAALTAGVRQSGILLALMVAPLMLPVLILGARATEMALAGDSAVGPLYLLGALLALATSLVPAVAGFAVRLSLD
jgi:heme exporter protein B